MIELILICAALTLIFILVIFKDRPDPYQQPRNQNSELDELDENELFTILGVVLPEEESKEEPKPATPKKRTTKKKDS